jgi:hypothetical protein
VILKPKWALAAVVVALGVLSLGQDSVEAAHGSEYHVTNVHMRSGGISDWYQGGFADCGAFHNVCWFNLHWFEWKNNNWVVVGVNSHSTPAGPANWHSSTAHCPYRFLGGSECWVWDHHDNSYETPPGHAVSPRFLGCKNWSADVAAMNYAGQTLDYDLITTYAYGCFQ